MAGETQIGKKHGFMYSNKKTGRKKTGRIREGFYNFADNTVYSTYVKIAIYIYTVYYIPYTAYTQLGSNISQT